MFPVKMKCLGIQMPSRDDIVAEAREWLGVRWQHQGRTRLHGIDCAGLVILVGNSLGLTDFDSTNYQRRTTGTKFMEPFKANMRWKPIPDAQPGDVLLFMTKLYPCHSAIVGERGGAMTIIHAHALRRKVIEERIDQGDWTKRWVACFEYIGVEE